MHRRNGGDRRQEISLARPRSAAPHIDCTNRAFGGQNDRTTGQRFIVLRVTRQDAWNIGN
jgi:hypothetical protein